MDKCDVWLWDGRIELEGCLVSLDEPSFLARLRPVRRSGTSVGQRLCTVPLDVQRAYARRRWLAHIQGPDLLLVEASFDSVQPSTDGRFEIVVAGRLAALSEEERELLRKMPLEAVAALMQRRVG